MRPAHYVFCVLVLSACTTQACLAKTARPGAKATTSASAPANVGSQQGSGANGVAGAPRTPVRGKADGGTPIDTRIAEPRRGPPNNAKPIDTKKIGVVGLPTLPSQVGTARGPLGAANGQNSTLRPPGISSRVITPPAAASLPRNAIGTATPSAQIGMAGLGRKGIAIAPAGTQAGLPRTGERPGIGPVGRNLAGHTAIAGSRANAPTVGRVTSASPVAAVNHGIINGTGMGRPASGPAAIGGAARNVAAGINGTGYRTKHP